MVGHMMKTSTEIMGSNCRESEWDGTHVALFKGQSGITTIFQLEMDLVFFLQKQINEYTGLNVLFSLTVSPFQKAITVRILKTERQRVCHRDPR